MITEGGDNDDINLHFKDLMLTDGKENDDYHDFKDLNQIELVPDDDESGSKKLLSQYSKCSIKKLRDSYRELPYYVGASAVPFMWELCPGTPKEKIEETDLLPLPPPPSKLSRFTASANRTALTLRRGKNPNHRVFRAILPSCGGLE